MTQNELENHLAEKIFMNTKNKKLNLPPLTTKTVESVINELYFTPPTDRLHESLVDDGIVKIEDAYVRGYQHALAELKMRVSIQNMDIRG